MWNNNAGSLDEYFFSVVEQRNFRGSDVVVKDLRQYLTTKKCPVSQKRSKRRNSCENAA